MQFLKSINRAKPDHSKKPELPRDIWGIRLATWFGTGQLPKTPGTWATLAAIPLVYIFALGGEYVYMTATFLCSIVGIISSQIYENFYQTHDSREIVIDEVAGMLITMTLVPLNIYTVLAGFFLFRFFDILKPWPIGKIDEKIPGGVGVMADDIAAGIVSNIVLQILVQWDGLQWIQLKF